MARLDYGQAVDGSELRVRFVSERRMNAELSEIVIAYALHVYTRRLLNKNRHVSPYKDSDLVYQVNQFVDAGYKKGVLLVYVQLILLV